MIKNKEIWIRAKNTKMTNVTKNRITKITKLKSRKSNKLLNWYIQIWRKFEKKIKTKSYKNDKTKRDERIIVRNHINDKDKLIRQEFKKY